MGDKEVARVFTKIGSDSVECNIPCKDWRGVYKTEQGDYVCMVLYAPTNDGYQVGTGTHYNQMSKCLTILKLDCKS